MGRLSTIGRLPEALRRRWGLEWTPAQERELRFYGALARRVFPLIPARLRLVAPAYAARERMRAALAA